MISTADPASHVTAHPTARPRRRGAGLAVALAAGVAVTMAACGGDDDDTGAAGTAATAEAPGTATAGAPGSTGAPAESDRGGAPSAGAATVELLSTGDHGDVLSSGGFALYVFTPDEGTGSSTCTEGCAQLWPPLTVEGDATAAAGVDAGQLATITRDDGSTQVTYHGWPLYSYEPDDAGETTGQGVGGIWWLIGPGGEPMRDVPGTGAGAAGY